MSFLDHRSPSQPDKNYFCCIKVPKTVARVIRISLSGFFFTDTDDLQGSRGREGPSLFLFTTFTHSRTFRQIFGTLLSHMRRQSHLNASHVFTKIYRNN